MIKSFKHKGLQRFFQEGSTAGIQTKHAKKLSVQLAALNDAAKPQDLSAPSWRLHPLKGTMAGYWSITVSENWRMTFRFDGTDAIVVDYQDYH
ncbi:MAG: Killer protein [Alcaligenaceae bacterium]|nr:Killer protein [Alcaligenaceae bacterium]